MAILVDTGILYALADADDRWHQPATTWLEDVSELLIVSVTALPEVAYLLHTRLGAAAELAFVQSLAGGELDVEDLRRTDLARSGEVMRRYPEIGLNLRLTYAGLRDEANRVAKGLMALGIRLGDHVAVPSCSRWGVRAHSARMRCCSCAP